MPSELRIAVKHGRDAFAGEAILVRVARYAGDARHGEVERLDVKASTCHEGDKEGTQTAVDMQADLVLLGQLGKFRNVVNDAVWEIGS